VRALRRCLTHENGGLPGDGVVEEGEFADTLRHFGITVTEHDMCAFAHRPKPSATTFPHSTLNPQPETVKYPAT